MAFFKSMWKVSSKHKKLSEELALQKDNNKDEVDKSEKIETENDVITFKIKYLGSTVVEPNAPENNTSTEAVKNIIKVAKASRKKIQRVNIAVSLKGIAVTDIDGNDLLKISIYRISNCSTDATHRQVFSFIATDECETAECHAFICPKRKMAESATLAVAHAFGAAYEEWRGAPKRTIEGFAEWQGDGAPGATFESGGGQGRPAPASKEIAISGSDFEVKLIDFDDEIPNSVDSNDDFCFYFDKTPNSFNSSHWVCFDDDFVPCKSDFKNDLIMA